MGDAGTTPGWATQELVEFSALISAVQDEPAAMHRAVERIAEVLDAEVVALLADGTATVAGPRSAEAAPEQLAEVAAGRRSSLTLAAAEDSPASCISIDGERPLELVVARGGGGLESEELGLVHGIGRILVLALANLALLRTERALREASERHADENARLLGELRERQTLLERLAQLQRAIVEQEELHEVLDVVARSGTELLGGDAVAVSLIDRDDRGRVLLAAWAGAASERPTDRRPPIGAGLGDRAMRQRRLLVADAASGAAPPSEQTREDQPAAAMAAPVFEREEVAGHLLVESLDPKRVYGPREQQVLLSLAEHASLALNHARAVDETIHGALHDALTGLPNRSLLLDRIEHALARVERTGGTVAVLFCDLDGFKTVNDSLGHTAGDRLLAAVAERLETAIRPADTIARMGGDEFAILIEEVRDPGEAARVANRVLSALAAPFEVRGREVYLTASVGIAAGSSDAETLVRNADLAMYRAKSRGRGSYAVFEPEMHRAVVERLELELDLKRAVERDELVLAYQPICDLRTGAVTGLEALVRWRHPTRGLVEPDRFVPLAEESGEISALGRWVLRRATHQVALWNARYPAHPGLHVGVNVSGAQLHGGLASDVAEALGASQLGGSALTVEVTETVLMTDFEAAIQQLEALKELGVQVAIDDFGVGYSSLRYLQRLPLDALKIDKSFVGGIGKPLEEPALLRAIVDLGEIFGLTVIAEGIETQPQRARMLELGCGLGQGHLFSKPLPPDAADAFLLGAGLLGPEAAAEAEAPEAAPGPSAPKHRD